MRKEAKCCCWGGNHLYLGERIWVGCGDIEEMEGQGRKQGVRSGTWHGQGIGTKTKDWICRIDVPLPQPDGEATKRM